MKKTVKDRRNSRKLILDAAEEVFAEKGFDGARVDEIARRAGVNKALLYYYFPGKDAILGLLLGKLVEEIRSLDDFSGREDPRTMLSRYLSYLETHRNLLRIILMESLKGSDKNDFSRIFLEAGVRFVRDSFSRDGSPPGDEQKYLVEDFFIAVMPILSFLVFQESWRTVFGIPERDLREYFLDGYLAGAGGKRLRASAK